MGPGLHSGKSITDLFHHPEAAQHHSGGFKLQAVPTSPLSLLPSPCLLLLHDDAESPNPSIDFACHPCTFKALSEGMDRARRTHHPTPKGPGLHSGNPAADLLHLPEAAQDHWREVRILHTPPHPGYNLAPFTHTQNTDQLVIGKKCTLEVPQHAWEVQVLRTPPHPGY